MQQYAEAHRLPPKQLSQEAAAWLQRYDWPGNVRELSHLMERVTLLSPEALIDPQTLARLCLPRVPAATPAAASPAEVEGQPLDEPARITQILRQTQGNVVQAARVLGLSRKALRYRMQRYGLARPGEEEPREGTAGRRDPADARVLAPAWEQKPVAVLAIEVTWPAVLEPDTLRYEPWTVHARWEQALVGKIQGFEGVLLQKGPALLLVAFGLPHTLEQLPHRAVQTAFVIRQMTAEGLAAEERAPRPVVRQAVHWGQVLVDGGASDPTARVLPIAETLAEPVRWLGQAAPGEILVSAPVQHLIEGWFEVQACAKRAVGQQALALASELGESALQEQISHYLGMAYYDIGDFGWAAELLRRSMGAADREAGTPRTDVWLLSQARLAQTLGELGAFTEGRRHGEEALRLATLAGRGPTPVVAHDSLGRMYLTQGALEHAIRMYDQGLALCRASGNRNMLRPIGAGLGYTSALQGRLAEGRALLEEAINEGIRIGAMVNHPRWVTWLSEACRLAGHDDEAWQHARQALDLARQFKERGNEAYALHQLGVVQAHAAPPDVAQAEAHHQQALALAEELGMRPLQAHCHRGLGTLYTKISQRKQARVALTTAIDLYRAMDMTFWLPQAEAALAQTSWAEEPEGGVP